MPKPKIWLAFMPPLPMKRLQTRSRAWRPGLGTFKPALAEIVVEHFAPFLRVFLHSGMTMSKLMPHWRRARPSARIERADAEGAYVALVCFVERGFFVVHRSSAKPIIFLRVIEYSADAAA